MDFSAFLLLHVMLTMGYFLVNRRRKPRLHVVTETIIVFAIPFFGILLMMGYRLGCYLLDLGAGRQPEIEKETVAFFRGTQLAEDIIPLNDAFLVDDVQKKRHYFTDAIKQAIVDNENILQMAMHDRDSAYAVINRDMAANCFGRLTYADREDDMGKENLRTAKLRYHPCEIKKKYTASLRR